MYSITVRRLFHIWTLWGLGHIQRCSVTVRNHSTFPAQQQNTNGWHDLFLTMEESMCPNISMMILIYAMQHRLLHQYVECCLEMWYQIDIFRLLNFSNTPRKPTTFPYMGRWQWLENPPHASCRFNFQRWPSPEGSGLEVKPMPRGTLGLKSQPWSLWSIAFDWHNHAVYKTQTFPQ